MDGAVDAYQASWDSGDPQGPLALAYEYRERGQQDRADDVLEVAGADGNATAAAVLACWRWSRPWTLPWNQRCGPGHHHRTPEQTSATSCAPRDGSTKPWPSSGRACVSARWRVLPLGNLYADHLGDNDLAEQMYRRGIEAGDIHCHHNLAVLLELRGDLEAAETHYRLGADAADALAARGLNAPAGAGQVTDELPR